MTYRGDVGQVVISQLHLNDLPNGKVRRRSEHSGRASKQKDFNNSAWPRFICFETHRSRGLKNHNPNREEDDTNKSKCPNYPPKSTGILLHMDKIGQLKNKTRKRAQKHQTVKKIFLRKEYGSAHTHAHMNTAQALPRCKKRLPCFQVLLLKVTVCGSRRN